jgi:hypothetical protein
VFQRSACSGGSSRNWFDCVSVVICVFLLVVVVLTFRDYGRTWDEAVHMTYGNHILRWYGSGFRDESALFYRIDYLYGGGFDFLGALFRRAARPMDGYDAIHLMGALIGIIGVAGTWMLGRVLGGPRAGFFSVLLIALTHPYYGHMFNNPKDLPFAVGHVWGLYFVCRAILIFPKLPTGFCVRMAIALGLAMSVRIGGLLLVCYFGMAIAVWSAYQGLMFRSLEIGYRYAMHLGRRGLAVVAGAWAVMLISWPWAVYDPIRRPIAALRRMSQFIDHVRDMPFDGVWISNLDAPRDYALHYLAYKLPEVVVLAAVGGLVFGGVWIWRRGWRPENVSLALAWFVLGLSIVFPLAYSAYKKPVLYDGLRHFLFIVPSIVVVAALVFEMLARRLVRRWRRVGAAVVGGLALAYAVDHVVTSVRYHPFQYVYFNRLIGGLAGADGRYSTDYYGVTYKEASETLVDMVWEEDPEVYVNSVFGVSGCIGPGNVFHYMPRNFAYERREDKFDFWVGYTRQKCHLRHDEFPIYFEIRRDGGLLTLARDARSRPKAKQEKAPKKKRQVKKPGKKTAPRGKVGDE